MAKKETDLVPFEKYALVTQGGVEAMGEILDEVLEGSSASIFDLEKLRVPAGGQLAWETTDADGDIVYVKEIPGIIVGKRNMRAYWSVGLGDDGAGAHTPPDCSSSNGHTGAGAYGPNGDQGHNGDCATCPMAEFGSSDKGKGQACKLMTALFLLRPESLLPTVMFAPPTSLTPIRRYMFALAGKTIRPSSVVTRFKLERKSSGANEYAVIAPEMGARLSAKESEDALAYKKALEPLFDTVGASFANSVSEIV